MSSRCQCRYCASSAFTQLLHSAQADEDAAHRQQAMDVIAWAAPYASTGADALVKPHLARLYPARNNRIDPKIPRSAPGTPPPQAAASARIAEIERQAIDAARQITGPGQDNG